MNARREDGRSCRSAVSGAGADSAERLAGELRELYQRYGYKRYRVSEFEQYDLYARNKRFLASPQILTFSDTDGRLMALKPDVTLSVIRNTRDDDRTRKV